jgi:hypothetical protein
MAARSEDVLVRAMRMGKHRGDGQPIMPPMPWQGLAQMDEDLKLVYAYLKQRSR